MNNTQNTDQLAQAITKALGYTENGGKPDPKQTKAGASGELKSIFQFTPDTWKKDSQQVLGSSDIPLTPDSETAVVLGKVKNWLSQGKTVQQIASMWNAGEGEPDAYTGKFSTGKESVGTNDHGVKYSVPDYVSKVTNYTKEFLLDNAHKTVAQSSNQKQIVNNLLSIIQNAPGKQQVAQNTVPSTNPGLVKLPISTAS